MRNELREKVKITLMVSALFSITLLFFAPSHSYVYNLFEYSYTYIQLLPFFLVVCVFSILVVAAVLFTYGAVADYRRLASLLFAVSLLLWLQGNIFVFDYGIFNGRDLDWENNRLYGIAEIIIWTLCAVFAFMRPAVILRALPVGSMALIFIQSVSLAILLVQAPGVVWERDRADSEAQFSFSSGKNVVILVLDTFQSDIFMEIVYKDKKHGKIFDGFTYFPDAVGGFPTTYPSVPLILTGQYYDNSVPVREFLHKAYDNSIPKVLKDRGFNVYFKFLEGTGNEAYADYENNNTAYEEDGTGIYPIIGLTETAPLFDMTLFRYLPHYGKKVVFDEDYNHPYFIDKLAGKSFEKDQDLIFVEAMRARSRIASAENSFKYYHLKGVHLPYLLNESLEYEVLTYSRTDLKRFAEAKIRITGMFLDQLKELGIYDNTMLFIIADHGDKTPEFRSPIALNDENDMSYLAPLILVKPFNSRGPMKLSKAPVSLSDIPKTLFKAMAPGIESPGAAMFDLHDSAIRTRRYLTYSWDPDDWRREYLTPMKEFEIEGVSWLRKSWQRTGRVFSPPGMDSERYYYGTYIDFGEKGNARRYTMNGWGKDDRDKQRSWTTGREASLKIPVFPPESTIILNAKLEPFLVKDRIESQTVIVKVNGKHSSKWHIKGPGEYKAYIPPSDVGKAETLHIVFETPDVQSPQELGIGWVDRERMSLIERGPADAVIALALIHHLAISNNLPFDSIASFFESVCSRLIIEFIPKEDSQVQRLLASRQDIFQDYTKEKFERAFLEHFRIIKTDILEGTKRTLYLMEKQ
jgi:hypothetical protein